ncbi:hypothetical protein JCGZ_24167 [Jatropha curcas]|uniref:Uncharacterized protein n=1 Tax=Jatropha curcas TaxID=180498 RepID=A0A067K1N0_JATCU|nr:hypothetical protein JCGZ_24167 [Jatropha curcas]
MEAIERMASQTQSAPNSTAGQSHAAPSTSTFHSHVLAPTSSIAHTQAVVAPTTPRLATGAGSSNLVGVTPTNSTSTHPFKRDSRDTATGNGRGAGRENVSISEQGDNEMPSGRGHGRRSAKATDRGNGRGNGTSQGRGATDKNALFETKRRFEEPTSSVTTGSKIITALKRTRSSAIVTGDLGFKAPGLKWKGKNAVTARRLQQQQHRANAQRSNSRSSTFPSFHEKVKVVKLHKLATTHLFSY